MKPLWPWFDNLPRSRRIGVLAGFGAGAILLFGLSAASALNAQLLRVYSDKAPDHPVLAAYARLRAQPVYQQRCASCHGADLQGDNARGVPRLDDQDWLYGEGRVTDIEQTIRYGVRSGHAKSRNLADMPAFGTEHPYPREKIPPLKPDQIRDVIEFLREKQALDHDAAAAQRGEAIYRGPGGCYDCHGDDAGGDPSIGAPNLDDHLWLHGDGSRAAVFRQVALGMAGICPAWGDRLSPGEIRALAVYIHLRAR